MKAWLPFFVLLVACHHGPPAGASHPTDVSGAPAPRLAVERFLAAAKAQDLAAFAEVWGTARGPARADIDRIQLEKREIILQCFLEHDKFRILGEGPGEAGRRVFQVELARGDLVRASAFTTVRGPADRWYVENVDVSALKDFCRRKPGERAE